MLLILCWYWPGGNVLGTRKPEVTVPVARCTKQPVTRDRCGGGGAPVPPQVSLGNFPCVWVLGIAQRAPCTTLTDSGTLVSQRYCATSSVAV